MRQLCVSLFLILSSLCYSTDSTMEVLISAEQIAARIRETATTLNQDYRDKELTVLMIMKGAICLTSDLMRHLEVPFKLSYIRASSYGYNGTKAAGLKISDLEDLDVEGKDVLIVDDILETGNTMLGVMDHIKNKHPKSIKTLLLLVKDIPRKTTYRPDYTLFEIPDRFVIGYGLDYKELYRGLPDICAFIDDAPPF